MKKKSRIIISILCIIILCTCLTFKSFDSNNDLFYFLKMGKDIFKDGISLVDKYSFISGLFYTYPHWLYSIFIYSIYSLFGFLGLYISSIILFILLALIIYFVMFDISKNNLFSLVITILSIAALPPFMVSRAQVLSTILFILEIYFINKLINTGKCKYVFLLMLISLLVANIHGTIWLMFFIWFLPFIGEYVIYKIKGSTLLFSKLSVQKITNIKLLFVSFILCFLMGIFTPSRICYSYLFKTMLGDSQSYISEHQPLVIIYYPLVLFSLGLLLFCNTKIKLREFFMIMGTLILSFISKRYLLFFYTVGFIYLGVVFYRYLIENNDNTFVALENLFYKKKIVSILISITFIGVCGFNLYLNLNTNYINKSIYPVDAVKYIKNNLDYKNIRMYNSYNVGSYLLFNDIPVFVDSRCDLYFKEFNKKGLDIFDDNIDIEKKYKKIFKKYNINYVLINKKDMLYYVLRNDSNYNKIYEDKNFILYKK